MPYYIKDQLSLYYETRGSGFPLLLSPAGGMRATIDFWQRTPFNPIEVFAQDFRVIAFDQRNAGRSTGPIPDSDPWGAYLSDMIGLLNHLGVEKCHMLGCCIGAVFALKMACEQPDRIAAAVIEQPVGRSEQNRSNWPNMFGVWADELCKARPELERAKVDNFGKDMWSGEFAMSVTREQTKACTRPLLVLPGIDVAHPTEIAHEIVKLTGCEMIEPWREPASLVPGVVKKIRSFLNVHTPRG